MIPLSGWSYCKPITVQHAYVDADLADFPYVVFVDGDTNIGAHALASGYDIRFTAADGVTLLSYERRSFAIVAGAATGRFVVKVPTIHTVGGDIIGIHYGKAGAPDVSSGPDAYDANFKGVWPGTDITTSTIADSLGISTGNKKAANEPTEEAGLIYKAQHLDGSDDYINCGKNAALTITGEITFETLVKFDIWPPAQYAQLATRDGSFLAFQYAAGGGGDNYYCYLTIGGAGVWCGSIPAILNNSSWWSFAFKYVSGTFKAYLQGLPVFSSAPTGSLNCNAANDFLLGTDRLIAGRYHDGLQAETRLSSISRSDAWIKFTYRNITEADHEATRGAEEAAVTGPAIAVVMHHLRMMRGD